MGQVLTADLNLLAAERLDGEDDAGVNLVRAAVAILNLDLFGHFKWDPQTDGNIVGNVPAANRDDFRVPGAAFIEKGNISCTAAYVGHNDAHFAFGWFQNGFGRGQGI